jgi:hypothetical protein
MMKNSRLMAVLSVLLLANAGLLNPAAPVGSTISATNNYM